MSCPELETQAVALAGLLRVAVWRVSKLACSSIPPATHLCSPAQPPRMTGSTRFTARLWCLDLEMVHVNHLLVSPISILSSFRSRLDFFACLSRTLSSRSFLPPSFRHSPFANQSSGSLRRFELPPSAFECQPREARLRSALQASPRSLLRARCAANPETSNDISAHHSLTGPLHPLIINRPLLVHANC